MGAEITPHAVTTTHDESDGLQNAFVTPTPAGDADDNDIDVALLPSEFSSRLIALNMDPTTEALGAALSGYTGGADEGDAIFTVTATDGGEITGILFADANGAPIVGVNTVTQTLDGNNIFLYSDSENDNIILGREGNGTNPDPDGDIVFAAYIEEIVSEPGQVIDGKLWVVQYEPIKHPGVGNPDDDEPIDLFGNVFVASTTTLEFSLENAPSGQNMFLMFAEENPTTEVIDGVTRITGPTIVATGKNPPDTSGGESLTDAGVDTINSSQAGGPTTFGSNNQMLTAGTKGNEGDGIVYTFVTGANQEFTIPNLSQTEADVETNVDFTDTFEARSAMFDVVQLQGGKTAVVQVSAFDTDPEPGDAFADDGYYLDDTSVAILEVVVRDEFGNVLEHSDGSVNTQGIDITIQGGIATISGVEANTTIEYTTDGDHNRVLIENEGDGKGKDSADFDIGAIQLTNVTTASASLQGQFIIEDDGPGVDPGDDPVADPLVVDESPEGEDSADGSAPVGVATVTADFSDNFTPVFTEGIDDEHTLSEDYTLELSAEGVGSGLYALDATDTLDVADDGDGIGQGVEILLNTTDAQTVTGSVNGTDYFTIKVASDGKVTLTQLANIWQGDTSDHDDSVSLAADLLALTRTDTITDADGDSASASASLDLGPALSFQDDGPSALAGPLTEDDMAVVDESPVPPDGDGVASASFSVADNFATGVDYGTDGAGSESYALELPVEDVASGLFALNPPGTGPGEAILLTTSGLNIVGTSSAGTHFTISVDAMTGEVTLTNGPENVWHSNTGDHDDTATLTAAAGSLLVRQTVTDADGDTASDVLDLSSGVFKIEDDGPSALAGPLTEDDMAVVDESPVPPDGDGVASASFSVADNFATGVDYGTDGAGSESYALELPVEDVASGLFALNPPGTGPGEAILLTTSGLNIVGTSSAGTHFTISVDAMTGEVTLTNGPENVWHSNTGDHDDTATLTAAAGSLLVRQTVTDADGDTASDVLDLSSGVFKIEDDGPSALAGPLTEDDMAVIDESPVPPDGDGVASASFSVADNFATGVDYGTDGAGSESYALELPVEDVASGLFALNPPGTGPGEAILLTTSGLNIVGTSSAGTHFTISVDAMTGEVTLTNGPENVWHSNTGDHDDTATLTAAAGSLLVRQTVTDADGDTASDVLDLSSGVFKIEDDGPSALAGPLTEDDMAVVDESPVPPDGDGVASASFSVADNFATGVDYGTDGAGSESYALELPVEDVASGLFALNPPGTGPGEAILLTTSGLNIVGTSSAGTHFTISVDAMTGEVTLTNGPENVWHSNTGDHDDTATLTAAAGSLLVRQTVTDADGDTASDVLDLSSGVFKIEDDGPSALAGPLTEDDMAVVDESPVPPDGDGVASASFSVADNFATGVDYGTDGAGSESYALELPVEDVASGLFALNPPGTGPGEAILLTTSGLNIVGTSSAGTHFTISVDAMTGEVTLTNGPENVWHSNTGDHDDTATLTAAAGSLLVRQTVTDADGDTASDVLDLSSGVFKIEDDGPSALAGPLTEDDMAVVDESPVPPDGDGVASASFSVADNFATGVDYGTDGAGSESYALELPVEDVASGLFALNPPGTGPGEAILLTTSGLNIVGTSSAGTHFTISVDAMTGEVTLTNGPENVWHSNTGDHDDTATLTAAAGSLLVRQTVTDADGDTASDVLDLSSGVFKIEDDGPSALAGPLTEDDMAVVDESPVPPDGDGVASASFSVADNFATGVDYGTDGAGSESYALELPVEDVASGLFALNPPGTGPGEAILLTTSGLNIVGTSSAGTHFTISVDAMTGEVTLTNGPENVWHSNTGDHDDTATLTAAAGSLLVRQTVTDADGDTASDVLDLSSGVFKIEDDGPSVAFDDLVGVMDASLQTEDWNGDAGTDGAAGLPDLALTGAEIRDSEGNVVDDTVTTTFVEGPDDTYSFTVEGDWDDDPSTPDQTLAGEMTVNADGSYSVQLSDIPDATVIFSSTDGSLDAGGPDPVRTLTIDTEDIVFFGVQAETPTNDIFGAILLGEPDLTEAQIEAGGFSFLGTADMNVSTAGIGIGNNNLNGNNTPGIDGTDESFVVNPESLISGAKVLIDNSVGGYDTSTEELYYTLYFEDGSTSGPTLVGAGDLTPESGGQVSFIIGDPDSGVNNIDAFQLTMGTGTIKVPVIDFIQSDRNLINDLYLDLTATSTDGDGDTVVDAFSVDLLSDTAGMDALLSSAGLENGETSGTGSEGVAPAESTTEVLAELVVLADEQDLQSGLVG